MVPAFGTVNGGAMSPALAQHSTAGGALVNALRGGKRRGDRMGFAPSIHGRCAPLR
jgi:hypothetical protein